MRAAAIAALCAVCLLAVFFGATYWRRQHAAVVENRHAKLPEATAIVDRTPDLTNYGTYRGLGDQPSQPPLNLPAAQLHLNLILPRFSQSGAYTIMVASDRNGDGHQSGAYTIMVASDRNGDGRLASTTGVATTAGNQTKLTVTLDLRGVKPGDYFLLTEFSGQEDFYSYPLNIQ